MACKRSKDVATVGLDRVQEEKDFDRERYHETIVWLLLQRCIDYSPLGAIYLVMRKLWALQTNHRAYIRDQYSDVVSPGGNGFDHSPLAEAGPEATFLAVIDIER